MLSLVAAVFYYGVAQYLPATNVPGGRVFTALRVVLIRRIGIEAGQRLDISRRVYLGLGRGVTIGDDSGVGIGAELHGPLVIGRHVMISPGVMIHTRNHNTSDIARPISKQGYSEYRQVTIEDDVWIGARAIILPGVTVGSGAVVGAGAVVAKDVPKFGVAVGNPARVVHVRGELGQ